MEYVRNDEELEKRTKALCKIAKETGAGFDVGDVIYFRNCDWFLNSKWDNAIKHIEDNFLESKILSENVKIAIKSDALYSFYINVNDFLNMFTSSKTVGCCHFYALLFSKLLSGSKYVTGYLSNLDILKTNCGLDRFFHSWVEFSNPDKKQYVFDTTMHYVFEKEYYYKNFGAQAERTIPNEKLTDELFFKLGCATCWYYEQQNIFIPFVYENFRKNYLQCNKIIDKYCFFESAKNELKESYYKFDKKVVEIEDKEGNL